MEDIPDRVLFMIILLTVLTIAGCGYPIERSGVVVDRTTGNPIEGVNIDIYMKYQRRDSLKEKIFTDTKGHFYIREKRDNTLLFELKKAGYTSHVSPLANANDTIWLEGE